MNSIRMSKTMKNLNSINDIKDFIKENKFVILYFSSVK